LGFFVIEKDEPSTEEDKRVDWIGAALVTAGLVLIVFVLSDTPTASQGWKNPREFFPPSTSVFSNSPTMATDIIALFVIGVLLVFSSSLGSTTWSAGSRTRIFRARAGRRRRS
jgi:hypothetical protein